MLLFGLWARHWLVSYWLGLLITLQSLRRRILLFTPLLLQLRRIIIPFLFRNITILLLIHRRIIRFFRLWPDPGHKVAHSASFVVDLDQVEGVYVPKAADTISTKLQLVWNTLRITGLLLRRTGCILRESVWPALQNSLQQPPRPRVNLRLLAILSRRLFLQLHDAIRMIVRIGNGQLLVLVGVVAGLLGWLHVLIRFASR